MDERDFRVRVVAIRLPESLRSSQKAENSCSGVAKDFGPHENREKRSHWAPPLQCHTPQEHLTNTTYNRFQIRP